MKSEWNQIQALQAQQQGQNPREFSPLVLAYIGDAVFELLIRQTVLSEGNAPVNKLHKKARNFVNAKAQAEFYFQIQELLTEEEQAVFKRGRNAKSFTVPKNAVLIDYKHATGLEALFGFLYLDQKFDRMFFLYQQGMKKNRKEKQSEREKEF